MTTTADVQFHLLVKPTGPICNLDCEYCYFLSKEGLYPGDRFRMSDDTLERYITQLLDAQPDGEVTIAWQGGEPTLMGIDFFRRAVALAEQRRRPGQQLAHMTVNGASVRTGDLYASGTVTGPGRDQRGSLLELSWGGADPFPLADGTMHTFLQDGDTVSITAKAPGKNGTTVGFGSVEGTVLRAQTREGEPHALGDS